MTLKEAAEMALDALSDFDYDKRMSAIAALRQALASVDTNDTSTKRVDEESKNVHEPVAWMNKHGACKTSLFREVEAGAKEEYTTPLYTHPQPAALTNCRHCGGPDNVLCGGQCKQQPAEFVCSTGLCHYKAKRWVGLTDEQIGMAFRKAFPVGAVIFTNGATEFARAIEQALKEKNT